MATLRMVAAAIRKDDYVISLDLSDAYFHVRVDARFRRFLRFKFRGRLFQFRAMPFNLSSAPRLFTKLTRAISSFCRKQGIRLIFSLDDTVIMAHSRKKAIAHRDFVMALLQRLGFLINLEKSDLAPSKQFQFLGLVWYSASHSVSLPSHKQSVLRTSASNLLAKHSVSCWDLQRFLGRTNFATVAVPRAHLNSHAIQACLSDTYKHPSHRFRVCPLSPDAHQELSLWVNSSLPAKPLPPPLPSETIATDAS